MQPKPSIRVDGDDDPLDGDRTGEHQGNVHGGVILLMCDEVAGIAAVRHSGRRCVTAGMDRMTFRHPVYVGHHFPTVRATVNAAWRTSMEVGVRVEAEVVHTGEITHTSAAYLTMVVIDEDGRPIEIPPLKPETADARRAREAQLRRDNRLAERERIQADRELDQIVSAGPGASCSNLEELTEAAVTEGEAHLDEAVEEPPGPSRSRKVASTRSPSSSTSTSSPRQGSPELKSRGRPTPQPG